MSRATEARILEAIAVMARDRFGWKEELTPTTRLVEDLALDSLKALELAIEVENLFRVRLDETSEATIETVGDLVAVIHRQTAGVQGGRS